jgi:hypothetical protein
MRVWLVASMVALTASSASAAREFVEADQYDFPSPVLFAKIFRFTAGPNQIYILAIPPQQRGVSRSSRT